MIGKHERWVHLHEPLLGIMGGKVDDSPASGDGSDHESKRDKIAKELEVIRNRRTGGAGNKLLANKENFVLVGGMLYAVF